jgi:hypothetical protein
MNLNNIVNVIFLIPLLFVLLLLPTVTARSNWPSPALENYQYYNVIFDEEGDAIIAAKLVFQNIQLVELKNIVIEIPGQMQIINVVQEIQTEKIRTEKRVPNYYGDYKEQNYGEQNYGEQNYEYKTIKYTQRQFSESSAVDFTLPQAVKEQEKAVLLIYYKVKGYVQKDWKTYDFNFATVKSSQDVNYVRVAINVQEGLYLEGLDGKVNYVDNIFIAQSLAPVTFDSAFDKMDSSEMTSYSRQLEYSSGLVKEASGLDPFENFKVAGKYADSWWWLKRWKVVSTIIVFGSVLVALMVLGRKIKIKNDKNKEIVFWSFLSALSSLVLVGGSFWLMDNLYHWIGYQYDELIAFSLGLAVVVAVLAALLLPPIYLGKKYNFTTGIVTVLAQAAWLIILSLGLMLVLLGFKGIWYKCC